MPLQRILDGDQMVADPAGMTQRGDRCGCVLEQGRLESRIAPRLCHHERTVARADLGFIGLDDGIERRRIDVALLGQNGFERAYAQLDLRQRRAVVVLMVMIVVGHGSRVPLAAEASMVADANGR
jgi:hypothetical protein